MRNVSFRTVTSWLVWSQNTTISTRTESGGSKFVKFKIVSKSNNNVTFYCKISLRNFELNC